MLVDIGDMLRDARANGYAVGAFEVVGLDLLPAVVAAAEARDAPIILAMGASPTVLDPELAMPVVRRAAERARVPVAIQLDRSPSVEAAVEAIRRGCNAVLLDASDRARADNVAESRALAAMTHACGVPVEATLAVAGAATPAEAERFVAETGVDLLALRLGGDQGAAGGEVSIDLEGLAALPVPIGILGGAGLGEAQCRRLVAAGVAKIDFTGAADAAARSAVGAARGPGSYRDLIAGVQDAVRAAVEHCIAHSGGTGRAKAAQAACRPWREVEHLIVYNVGAGGPEETRSMKAAGQRILGTIPGVRQVVVGESVREDAPYRHCWLIRFVQPAVIDSYREHPDHKAFADDHFRPVAGDRITIDFQHQLD